MKIEVLKRVLVAVKPAAKRRLAIAEKKHLCVACFRPLGDGLVIRGCHQACYQATRRAINSGYFTDADRVAEGKLLASKTGGGKPHNPVTLEARA